MKNINQRIYNSSGGYQKVVALEMERKRVNVT
jgi:hypothetical protein